MEYIKPASALIPFLLLLTMVLQDKSCRTPQMTLPQNSQAQNSSNNKNANKNGEPVLNTKLLPEGAWGGQHISLIVDENGATLEYDCAHGTIDQRIELDDEGRFDVKGKHRGETGGPTDKISTSNEDGTNSSRPADDDMHSARYRGRITGDKMVLTVKLTTTDRNIGTFNLTKGATPKLYKCL